MTPECRHGEGKMVFEDYINIEEERITLCYGNRKSKERIEKTIKNFQELRRIINENLKDKNVTKK